MLQGRDDFPTFPEVFGGLQKNKVTKEVNGGVEGSDSEEVDLAIPLHCPVLKQKRPHPVQRKPHDPENLGPGGVS